MATFQGSTSIGCDCDAGKNAGFKIIIRIARFHTSVQLALGFETLVSSVCGCSQFFSTKIQSNYPLIVHNSLGYVVCYVAYY